MSRLEAILPKLKSNFVVVPDASKKIFSQSPDFTEFEHLFGHQGILSPVVGTVSFSLEDIEITKRIFKRIHEEIEDPALMDFFTMEVLAKAFAYRQCLPGISLSLRGVEYIVDRVFNLGGGVPAYGLLPVLDKTVPPILLYRGSEFAINKRGMTVIKANLDLSGPGFKLYQHSRKEIRRWLEEVSTYHSKARVVGFSLGGILAAYTVLFDRDLVQLSSQFPSYAFNMPGVTKKILKEWEKIPKENLPLLKVYVNRGDAVSKIGYLIGDVFECSIPLNVSPVKAHNSLLLGQNEFLITPVDLKQENASKRFLSFR